MRAFWLATLLCGVTACGNTSGGDVGGTGDATASDLQISGTDSIDNDGATTDATTADVADASGTDAATVDITPDIASTCQPSYTGSIPGATLDLSKTPCAFSISAAKGVFNLNYALQIATAEQLSIGGNLAGCLPQEASIHGGIATFEVIDGPPTQKWCICDVGLCAPVTPPFTASIPGDYLVPFTWDGNNWYGPSDTGNKPGPAFTPGNYVFTVSVSGDHKKADGSTVAFSASAKLPITLTP